MQITKNDAFKNISPENIEQIIYETKDAEPVKYLTGAFTSLDPEILLFFLEEGLDFTLLVQVYLCMIGVDRNGKEVDPLEANQSWFPKE